MKRKITEKLAEQFVGQELRASHNENLFYWSREKRGSSAETDYLIEKKVKLIPGSLKNFNHALWPL